MSFPQILEVAIAMAVVYYLLGLVVSFITKRITEIFETRGKILESYIKEEIIGSTTTIGDFYKLPQLEPLKSVRYKGFLGLQTLFTGKVKKVETKIENIPVTNLVDAFMDFCKLGSKSNSKKYTLSEIQTSIDDLPDSKGKDMLNGFVAKGVKNVDDFREKISMSFNGMLDQVSAEYKVRARQVVILLSIFITFFFAVDSIDLARQFRDNADLRMIADAKASAIVQNDPEADLDQVFEDLGDLKIEFGLNQLKADFNSQEDDERLPWVFWKFVGLSITAVAVSQGSSFWYDILRKLKGESAPSEEKPE